MLSTLNVEQHWELLTLLSHGDGQMFLSKGPRGQRLICESIVDLTKVKYTHQISRYCASPRDPIRSQRRVVASNNVGVCATGLDWGKQHARGFEETSGSARRGR